MALHRGIQSALFYYLSCAPCTEARTRRNRKREADLLRAEKEAQLAAQPDGTQYYSHPLPSTTNPAWAVEIALGPSKESKAAARLQAKKEPQECPPRNSASTGISLPPTSLNWSPDFSKSRSTWTSAFQLGGFFGSKKATTPADKPASKYPSRSETTAMPRASVDATNMPMPPPRAKVMSPVARPPWATPLYPSINSQHPATVTKYDSAREASWMLEPPPPAKVMRGLALERPHKPINKTPSRTVSSRRDKALDGVDSSGLDISNLDISGLDSSDLMNDDSDFDGLFSPSDLRDLVLECEDDEPSNLVDFSDNGDVPKPIHVPKRRSASPPSAVKAGQPSKLAPFVFPANTPRGKHDPEERRDSGTTVDGDWDDLGRAAVGGEARPPPTTRRRGRRPENVRWRWSIDW